MKRARVCGARCHDAVTIHCKCWCDGAFHGARGAYNRKNYEIALKNIFGYLARDLEAGRIKYKEVTKSVNPKRKMS